MKLHISLSRKWFLLGKKVSLGAYTLMYITCGFKNHLQSFRNFDLILNRSHVQTSALMIINWKWNKNNYLKSKQWNSRRHFFFHSPPPFMMIIILVSNSSSRIFLRTLVFYSTWLLHCSSQSQVAIKKWLWVLASHQKYDGQAVRIQR